MKNFWIHQLLGFSALTDRLWVSATLRCGCCGWRNSCNRGGIFPEQQKPFQANQSLKQVSLQWVRRETQFLLLAGKATLKGCCGRGGAGERCLFLVSRIEEVRYQKEIRDLGRQAKYKKRGVTKICPVIQVLYTKWKTIVIHAKRSEQCKRELKQRISYRRNDANFKDPLLDLSTADVTVERAICNVERLAAASWVGISGMCPSCWPSPVDKDLMTGLSTSPTSKSHQIQDSKCRSILGMCNTAFVTCVTAWTCSCNLKGDEDCLSDFKGLFSLRSSLRSKKIAEVLKMIYSHNWDGLQMCKCWQQKGKCDGKDHFKWAL